MSDFFDSDLGLIPHWRSRTRFWRKRKYGRAMDRLFDLGAGLRGAAAKMDRLAADVPHRRILVTGVSSPKRPGELEAVVAQLTSARHEVCSALIPMADCGKFANTNAALAAHGVELSTYDWLVVTDDDVGLPPNFLDRFIGVAEAADLKICQPAHRFHSYSTFIVTQRAWGALARETQYVEIGPLIALHRDTFAQLVPFPDLRWCWGIDAWWPAVAKRQGWRMGVVDGTPIEHQRPIAANYSREAAIAEAEIFLSERGGGLPRAEMLTGDRVAVGW